MSNHSNSHTQSQPFSQYFNREHILSAIRRCNEIELLILERFAETKIEYDAVEIAGLLELSNSASSNILRRLSDKNCSPRLKIELLNREKAGANGSYLYSLKEGVVLKDIQEVMELRRYSLEKHLKKQQKKIERNNTDDKCKKQKSVKQESVSTLDAGIPLKQEVQEAPKATGDKTSTDVEKLVEVFRQLLVNSNIEQTKTTA